MSTRRPPSGGGGCGLRGRARRLREPLPGTTRPVVAVVVVARHPNHPVDCRYSLLSVAVLAADDDVVTAVACKARSRSARAGPERCATATVRAGSPDSIRPMSTRARTSSATSLPFLTGISPRVTRPIRSIAAPMAIGASSSRRYVAASVRSPTAMSSTVSRFASARARFASPLRLPASRARSLSKGVRLAAVDTCSA